MGGRSKSKNAHGDHFHLKAVSMRSTWTQFIVTMLVVVAGSIAAHHFIAMAFASALVLNGLIVGTGLIGVILIFFLVWHLHKETSAFAALLANLSYNVEDIKPAHKRTDAFELIERLRAAGLGRGGYVSPATIDIEIEGFAAATDHRTDIAQYLVGGMVALGLVGTFHGLLETLVQTADLIASIGGATGGNMEESFKKLIGELQKPLASMGTAFSASLFGLLGSMLLGYLLVILRKGTNQIIHAVKMGLLNAAIPKGPREPGQPIEVTEEYLASFLLALETQHAATQALLGRISEASSRIMPAMTSLTATVTGLSENQLSLASEVAKVNGFAASVESLAQGQVHLTEAVDAVTDAQRAIEARLTTLPELRRMVELTAVSQAQVATAIEQVKLASGAASQTQRSMAASIVALETHYAALAPGVEQLSAEVFQLSTEVARLSTHTDRLAATPAQLGHVSARLDRMAQALDAARTASEAINAAIVQLRDEASMGANESSATAIETNRAIRALSSSQDTMARALYHVSGLLKAVARAEDPQGAPPGAENGRRGADPEPEAKVA
jgi:hypothetical protein